MRVHNRYTQIALFSTKVLICNRVLCRQRAVYAEVGRCVIFALSSGAVALMSNSFRKIGLLMALWHVVSAVACLYITRARASFERSKTQLKTIIDH